MSEINEAALPFPHWNTGFPPSRMLTDVVDNAGFLVRTGRFIIDDGESILIRQCRRTGATGEKMNKPRWLTGMADMLFCEDMLEPVRWMQLPESVGNA